MILARRTAAPRVADIARLHRLQIGVVAVMTILTNFALFSAFERTSVALVLICFYTFPVMVAIAAVRVYGEVLTRTRIAALLLASLGMLLVVLAPALGQEGVQVDPIGIALGLSAAVFQTVYSLIAGRGYPSLSASQAAAVISSVAAVGYILIVLLGGSMAVVLTEPSLGDGGWLWLVVAAVIGVAIPTAAVLAGFRQLGPTGTSILMLFEPVVGVLLAALFIAQRPSALQLVGGLMVLAGGALAQARWRGPNAETVQQYEAERV
jgi:drug/metabolite transporter (DMT)-like permease